MSFRLASLRRTDLARCAELETILFPDDDPWRESAFRAELDAGHHYVGAYTDGGLIGYAGLSVQGHHGDAEANVHTIGVDPKWQGQGVGRALLRALLGRADEFAAPVFLEVRTDNEAAIGLYEAHGFTRIGLRRRYYWPSGADAYTMARPAGGTESHASTSGLNSGRGLPDRTSGERDASRPQVRDQTEPSFPNATNTLDSGEAERT